jgi:O-antigen/teichoic acid export membrane protein
MAIGDTHLVLIGSIMHSIIFSFTAILLVPIWGVIGYILANIVASNISSTYYLYIAKSKYNIILPIKKAIQATLLFTITSLIIYYIINILVSTTMTSIVITASSLVIGMIALTFIYITISVSVLDVEDIQDIRKTLLDLVPLKLYPIANKSINVIIKIKTKLDKLTSSNQL